ncbi:Hpt domain-containing protein [Celeribacter halophilus]|uniref:Hpt domain-containing protein n=1 Tax=Celeribacter halophilus TaxID=576117 RepID=UPI003A953DB2
MIDWKRIEELRAEVGEEDFTEIASIFLEEVDEMVARIRNDQNPNSLEQDLHFLKGSSLNLGFTAFSSLCYEGEIAARRGDVAQIDLPKLFETYTHSRAEFLKNVVI